MNQEREREPGEEDGAPDPTDADDLVPAGAASPEPTPTLASQGKGRIKIECLADVAPAEVDWLWPGRLPAGSGGCGCGLGREG